MNRLKIAQYIALGATAVSVIGLIIIFAGGIESTVGNTIMSIGIIAGLVSYIFGGFGTALKMAGKIARWGWVAVPFPFDLVTVIASFVFAIIVFLILPILPVRKAYKESMSY